MQLLVLGMHRSGTSMVTRLLNMAGAYFGPEGIATEANEENPKGFWERRDVRAGSLSGGQQQQLALGRVLLHDPEVLLIDELSLGLSPTVVEELLVVIERLKAAGQTMVIVEQSLNVALAFADRAVFMEKGRIRFEGPARDLLERDDLVRAVFLGGEEG